MRLIHAQRSSAGTVRESNEDYIACWPPDAQESVGTIGLAWLLADGVGGESRGELASQMAVTSAIQALKQAHSTAKAPDLLSAMFEAAGRAVYDFAMASPEQGPMGTTLNICLFRENALFTAHVGDSRVYLVRQGKVRQLTTDHCYVGTSVKYGLVKEHKAMTDTRRSMLTRCVGHDPIVNFDTTRTELMRGDIVMQCTDGMYAYVTPQEICDVISHFSPEEACRYLTTLAERRQVDDNLSIQVIKVQELDPIAYRQGTPVYKEKGSAGTSSEIEPGQILDDRYEITELISRSGMACIFKAQDLNKGALVAIKVPHMQFESDVATFTRFQREEEIGQQLNHPYILKVIPTDRPKSRPYLIMEFLEGRTLDKVMAETRPLPEAEAARITSLICEALAHMHQRNIVHRDLKPQNIMVCQDGSIRIIDFGIAKASRMRRLTFAGYSPMMGTPDYMAPEQVNGRRGDHRSDIYSLGAILYEMTTGKVPFEGESPYVTMNMRTTGDPTAPRKINEQISPVMEEIILHALARNPDQRYSSASQMKAELENYNLVELTGRHLNLESSKPWKTRFHLLPLITFFVVLLLAGYALMFWYFTHHGRH
jgi:serine/threonine-protein kinase